MYKPARGAISAALVCAAILLGGCSVGSTGISTGSDDPTDPIQIEEDRGTVDVTIARSLVDPSDSMSDEEIIAAAEDKGFSATVDGDSVTYTMTEDQRDEMLSEVRSGAQEAIDEMIADDSNSITDVEFDDEMTSFKVAVDGERFAPLESLLVLGFYVQGALYQQFAGVAPDDIDVKVEFVDDSTGEVLESGSYQEMRENLGQ